ncbi:predicted protein [Naegleria gruberi]|uniref:folate gamma-glutamyl hydrolase n=1 Tax=Naegleria gruberi TaxID=5762 RepID=D2VWH0_NAEGR|nr:uncharacterized protein NAEGRDRAFT_60907 [Naegleria gruberi]EFC38836.1 predicted protein [Naegleria gruberi]|eukprot:XP_002671580.1 predicted protein [Naegleria gruberi strain NEG-M]
MAQPTYKKTYGESYLAASYVKWIESGGARVVPIPYDLPQEKLNLLFNSLNGIVFPGGGTSLRYSEYYYTLKFFFDKAIEANNRGDYFPIWGTCLGFEALNVLAADNPDVLHFGFDSENLSLNLHFVNDYKNSRIFGKAPLSVMQILAEQNVTMNNHMAGITPETFMKNDRLNQFYKMLSVNADRKGQVFVSTIESLKYPIYGTQFHPEKIQFEFNYEDINHSYDSVLANQYFANFFVNEARKNQHKFSSFEVEQSYSIYNFNAKFTFPEISKDFVQIYYFNASRINF